LIVATVTKQTRAEQLLANALELFSQGGYRETSLQEIASKLGITRPLFYYYFESKDELLWRIIGHLGDDLLAHARPIAEYDEEPVEKLRLLLEGHADMILRNAASFRIYFAERHLVTGKRERRLRQGEDAYLNIISEVISDGQKRGEFKSDNPRLMALLITGMANSMLRWFIPNGPLSVEEITQMYARAGLDAVRVARPPAGARAASAKKASTA
jgi:AcrR family transcriptional regulator